MSSRSGSAIRRENLSRDPWYLAAAPLATKPWLIRARWTTTGVELALLGLAFAVPQLNLPLDHIAWLLVADAAANGVLAAWLSRRGPVPHALAAMTLATQILLLTALLELTGGPSNPFVVVYGLQLTLAALTLGAAWTTLLALFACASFGVLVDWHVHELVPTHHRLNDFPTHLFTIWLAGTVVAELVAHFVEQASDALLRRERELESMRLRAARVERLVSITTLAAGAAHELSTPLATIALASRELEHALQARPGAADLTEDARLIRSEVGRCQLILDQMSGRAGGAAADHPELIQISALVDDVRSRLSPDAARRLVVRAPVDLVAIPIPRAGLSQALTSLLRNAFDASPPGSAAVVVSITQTEDAIRLAVEDQGHGLTAEGLRRAGEPFYTTKEPGQGLGLGLFLARVFAERLGGSLTLESTGGTTAVLELPVNSTPAQAR